MSDVELDGQRLVTTSATTSPAALTSETWTVTALPAGIPTLTGGGTYALSDVSLGASAAQQGEIVRVTAATAGATSITVTRGVDGTTPVAHAATATFAVVFVASAHNGLPSTFGLVRPPLRGIPVQPIQRTGDNVLVANTAYIQPADVPQKTRVRRFRLTTAAILAGDMSVGACGVDRARIVTSGLVNNPPSGIAEIALPPTDIPSGVVNAVLSCSVAATVAGNSTQGNILGAESAAASHPIPAALTGVTQQPIALAVQLLPDDPTPLVAGYTYTRTQMPITCYGKIGTKLYGRNRGTDQWATSTDNGTTWTDQAGPTMATLYPGIATYWQLFGHSTFMILVTSGGKVWRAPLDNFNTWTDISGGWRAGTTGRQGELASDGTNLLYGCYNADVPTWTSADAWRSTDNGATWTNVLHVVGARHCHAVAFDPVTPTKAWATIGDDVALGGGLYLSTDSGATWVLASSSRYGIDIAFAQGMNGAVSRVILEGDGTLAPHIMHYFTSLATGARTDPTIYPDLSPTDGKGSWGGTARAALVTTEGNLFYASTFEAGAAPNFYTRSGWWFARGPWFTTPVLLEEFSPASSEPSLVKSYESGAYIINGSWRIPKPKFAGQ